VRDFEPSYDTVMRGIATFTGRCAVEALIPRLWGYLHDPSKGCTKLSQERLAITSKGEQYLEFFEDMREIRPRKKASRKVHLVRRTV
jgi:hypothetical protein